MKKLSLALLIFCFIACQQEKKTDQQQDSSAVVSTTVADTLTFSYDSVKVYSKSPLSPDKRVTDTAKAVILYPKFKDQALNDYLQQRICSTANNDTTKNYKTYQVYAEGFIREFDDFQKDNEDRIQTWFLSINSKVLLQNEGYISLSLDYLDYTGGAHPNPSFGYVNYDINSHKPVTLDSLIKPGSMPKLQSIAERIFRKNEGLTPTQSLANNYFFENDTFHLAQNYTITNQGLLFLYNPYEIKPYASGRTRLLIPFAGIKDLVKPNSILSRFN